MASEFASGECWRTPRESRSFDFALRQIPDLLEKVGQRSRQLAEIAGMQAFIGSVGLAEGVFDAKKQCRRPAEKLRQRPHEADRPAAADRHRLDAEALFQGLLRRGEGGAGWIGHPPF